MKSVRTLLVMMGLFATTAHADDTPSPIRVQAMPSWSIVIPRQLEQVNNGDSWQAFDEQRAVYVASLLLSPDANASVTVSADKLAATMMTPVKGRTGPVLQHHADHLEGRAALFRTDRGFDLKGFMITKDRAVACVVSFSDEKDQSWAIDTWRSLRLTKTPPATK